MKNRTVIPLLHRFLEAPIQHRLARLAAGFWAVTWQIYENIPLPWWHISNKWFLGAAVHTRSKSIASLYLNDWFLDFRLSGYIPQRAAVRFLNVWSCIMWHILKMYVQFFKIYLQIKRAAKLGERKQRGLKRSDIFLSCEIMSVFSNARKAATHPIFL